MAVQYGKTKEESNIEDNIMCREIVQEILNFGVTQGQLLQIVYLLSLELEETHVMQDLSQSVKKYIDIDDSQQESGVIIT